MEEATNNSTGTIVISMLYPMTASKRTRRRKDRRRKEGERDLST